MFSKLVGHLCDMEIPKSHAGSDLTNLDDAIGLARKRLYRVKNYEIYAIMCINIIHSQNRWGSRQYPIIKYRIHSKY